jgi:isopenicillin-N N-acyltransferase-like protein
LPHYPVKRRLYECRTRAEVLAMWERFPVCSSGNYMCAAGDPAIFDLEVTPEGFAEFTNGRPGWLGHANHFLTDRFRTPETDAAALPDSFPRQARIESLLSDLTARGNVTVEDLKAVLADHHGRPTSICRHDTDAPEGMKTAAGLIAEPQSGQLHLSDGNPCEGRWTVFSL